MAQRTSRFKRSLVVVIAVVLGLAGVGVAFAYWTSTGTGDGTATTETSTPFTVAMDPADGELAPGGPGETIAFTVTNPADTAQYLTGVTVSLATPAGVAWDPTGDCDPADYVATISTAPPVGDIPANGTVNGEATVTLTNTAVNQDDCQGQIVPVHLVASAAPAAA
jgi:hypothetical protein